MYEIGKDIKTAKDRLPHRVKTMEGVRHPYMNFKDVVDRDVDKLKKKIHAKAKNKALENKKS